MARVRRFDPPHPFTPPMAPLSKNGHQTGIRLRTTCRTLETLLSPCGSALGPTKKTRFFRSAAGLAASTDASEPFSGFRSVSRRLCIPELSAPLVRRRVSKRFTHRLPSHKPEPTPRRGGGVAGNPSTRFQDSFTRCPPTPVRLSGGQRYLPPSFAEGTKDPKTDRRFPLSPRR